MSLDLNGRRADTVPMTSTASFTLRPATSADAGAVAYLSELDETERLEGAVVLAFDGDRAVAAMSLADGRTAADPFAYSAEAVDLLRWWARDERRSGAARRRFGLRALRLAA